LLLPWMARESSKKERKAVVDMILAQLDLESESRWRLNCSARNLRCDESFFLALERSPMSRANEKMCYRVI
jgi:hypothetical protein